MGNGSVLELTSGSGLVGDSTFPDIIVEGTINYTGTGALEVNGVDLGVKGDIVGVSDISIGESLQAGMTLYANTWAHNKDNQYTFGNVNVGQYGTLTTIPYINGTTDYSLDYGVTLNAENITVANNGVITAKGLGYTTGPGTGTGDSNRGGSYGGFGGGSTVPGYGDVYEPAHMGNGGRIAQLGGFKGGGAIKLVVSDKFLNNGLVTADGEDYRTGGGDGGPSGGSIWIDTNKIDGNGIIRANGTRGFSDFWNQSMGGSGGRIAIYYTENQGYGLNADKIQARGIDTGGAGTVYVEQKGVDTVKQGLLIVDNNNIAGEGNAVLPEGEYAFKEIKLTKLGHLTVMGNSSILQLTSGSGMAGDATFPKLEVQGTINYTGEGALEINGVDLGVKGDIVGVEDIEIGVNMQAGMTLYANTWAHNKDNQYTFGNVTVGQYGTLTMISSDNGDLDYTNDYGVTFVVEKLAIAQGGNVNADGKGYGPLRGPAAGSGGYCEAIGPSHGGFGKGVTVDNTYGDLYQPRTLGSGSGDQYGGTNGGGSMHIVAGDLILDGRISADGGNTAGACNTGGAGGSVYIVAENIAGSDTGSIHADGKNGNDSSQGGAGGGRIGIYYRNDDFGIQDAIENGRIHVYGGVESGSGTIYVQNNDLTQALDGRLYIGKNLSSANYTGALAGVYNLHSLTVQQNAKIKINPDTSANRGVVLNLAGNFIVEAGAFIDGVGMGYSPGQGPGKGTNATGSAGGGGGSHGGAGGAGESDGVNLGGTPGGVYGDQRQPMTLGSGGGQSGAGALGGFGGGALTIKAREGIVNIAGNINMNGTNGLIASPGGGGGAGGSIMIEGRSCDITGDLLAEGGDGGNEAFDGGGAGGGRISILYTDGPCNVLGAVSVAQGTSEGGQSGQVGTYPDILVLPSVPAFKDQFMSDSATVIPRGSYTLENKVVLKSSVFDIGASNANPKNLAAEFEVKPRDVEFDGNTNLYLSNVVNFRGGTAPVVSFTLDGLSKGSEYKWRVRTKNVTDGVVSNWTEYGANPSNATDFGISTVVSLKIEILKDTAKVGEKVSIKVSAFDAANKVDGTYRGTIVFESDSTGLVLPSNYTFSQNDKGSKTFVDQLAFTQPGNYVVKVKDKMMTNLTSQSNNILVSPADSTGNESCFENPYQLRCQINVEVRNVNLERDESKVTICWQTNIETRGLIEYGQINNKGKGIYNQSTTVSNDYVTSHCQTIDNLESNVAYVFRINSTSYAQKSGIYEGVFAVSTADIPEAGTYEVVDYIFNVDYSFTSQDNLLLEYETLTEAFCRVNYGHDPRNLEFEYSLENSGVVHSAIIDLALLDGTRDILYKITCVPISGDGTEYTATGGQAQIDGEQIAGEIFAKNGIITKGRYSVYYPKETKFIDNLKDLAENEMPIALLALTAGSGLFSLLLYPRVLLYAIGLLKYRQKKAVWGLVYDQADMKPVAFASVKIYDNEGTFVRDLVTNMEGKYGIPIDKGDYKLVVEHNDYQTKELDVKVKKDEFVTQDIALSKEGETKIRIAREFLKENFSKIIQVVLYGGFVFSLIALVLYPVFYNLLIVALYVVQYIIFSIMKTPRGWGFVFDSFDNTKVAGAFVRLYDVKSDQQLDVQLTDQKGRYGFNIERGKYEISVDAQGYEFPSKKEKKSNLNKKAKAEFLKVDVDEAEAIDVAIPLDPVK